MTSTLSQPNLDIRRSGDRFKSNAGWLDSKHSFSFSNHYDPKNTHHGLLLVNNDDIVTPGMGFDTHPHQDMEIVTWVLRGSLVHQDSMGHSGVIYPGLAQRMSAGTGILHSEKNDSWRLGDVAGSHSDKHSDPVHFIQMWVIPDETGITPGYEQLEIDAELLAGGLVPVASGMDAYADHSAIRIKNKYAAMHVARLQPGQPVTLPDAPFLHVFVADGQAAMKASACSNKVTRCACPAAEASRSVPIPVPRSSSGKCTPPFRRDDMKSFSYDASPARIVFGQGTIREIAEEVRRLGRSRVMVLASRRLDALAADVTESLGDMAVVRFDGAVMHTPTEVTTAALKLADTHHVDIVVAIGGGSATGLSKALALRAGVDQIIVPTTYAGSEVTPVLGETDNGRKTTRSSPDIRPETVVYDVDLTLDLPLNTRSPVLSTRWRTRLKRCIPPSPTRSRT